MKNLGAGKYILIMEIKRDRMNTNIWLNQSKYMSFVIQFFCVEYYKPLSALIFVGTKVSVENCPTTPTSMDDMPYIPYTRVVGSLIYSMVFTKPNITQIVGILSGFMANLGHEHWATMKRFLGIFKVF